MVRLFPMPAALLLSSLALMACGSSGSAQPGDEKSASPAEGATRPSASRSFTAQSVATFDEPWAMSFIGSGPWALITEKSGRLILLNTQNGERHAVSGVPKVDYGGQGGLGDVVMGRDTDPSDKVHPLYLSWAEAGSGDTRGAVVARADLLLNPMTEGGFALTNLKVIWRQQPKVNGRGHYSHRIALSPDGAHLFIASGERQKMAPAQDMNGNLGKIVRLTPDGGTPVDNPFAAQDGLAAQTWSLGHRNVLGLTFDGQGKLWEAEMGPEGGDEVNLVAARANYGWPRASNGSHYGGEDIPDHKSGDGFAAPAAWWTPSISPSSLAYYDGALFPDWKGSLFVGALSGEALIRLKIEGERLVKADHWPMSARIREVEAGPDGALWLLEDGKDGRLLRLTPASTSRP